LDFKNWKLLDFKFFVGDVISGIGLGIFRRHWALGTNCKSQLFNQVFIGN